MSLFAWLKDHLKVAVASLLVAILGVFVATLALINDRYGGNEAAATAATVTSTPASPAAMSTPSSDPLSGPPSPGQDETDGSPGPESPEPSNSESGDDGVQEVGYLDEIDDTDRNGGFRREAVNMAGTNYQRGVQFTCNGKNTYFVFPVAGYKTLSFYLGIDDKTDSASGLAGDVTFYANTGRQLGAKKYTAVLGPAKKVEVDIAGVVQLKIKCYGRDAKTNEHQAIPYIAFGEAILTSAGSVS